MMNNSNVQQIIVDESKALTLRCQGLEAERDYLRDRVGRMERVLMDVVKAGANARGKDFWQHRPALERLGVQAKEALHE